MLILIPVLDHNASLKRLAREIELVLGAPLTQSLRAHIMNRGSLCRLGDEGTLFVDQRDFVAWALHLIVILRSLGRRVSVGLGLDEDSGTTNRVSLNTVVLRRFGLRLDSHLRSFVIVKHLSLLCILNN